LLMCIALSAYAQFTFVRIDPAVVYGPADGQIKSHGVVRNTTGSNITLDISIINRYVTSGWDSIGICDWHLCYGAGTYNITSLIPPGVYETLYVYFSPNNILGTGSCTVRITYQSTTIDQDFAVSSYPIGIQQISTVVKDFALGQNYPNPFNPVTNIEFSIPKNEYVLLKVYDILGREVKSLVNQNLTAGEYKVDFDAKGLSSGMYYYSLRAGENVTVKKMVLVK
ncbi:MAG TPA: T9SS type A sorting domain-containing protein, partial [Ignavibacteria bacterium]